MAGLGFEETELRLGLPGGNDAGDAAARKRGFEETIDLKLKLEQPAAASSSAAAHVEEDEQQEEAGAGDVVVPAATQLPSPLLAATTGGAGTTLKRSPSQSSVVTADAQPTDPEKPRAPKAQAVGWPPVRSFRKNILAVQSSQRGGGDGGKSAPALVKLSMDGAPYLRKVDLTMYGSYQELSKALQNMFTSFTIGSCRSQEGTMNDGSDEYVPTYEDKDGDWMPIGDVPWEMFVESCKRLRIMKGSEAVDGLAPRAMDKCNDNSC